MAEHMTFNHGVRSSTLRWVTKNEKRRKSRVFSVFLCFSRYFDYSVIAF